MSHAAQLPGARHWGLPASTCLTRGQAEKRTEGRTVDQGATERRRHILNRIAFIRIE